MIEVLVGWAGGEWRVMSAVQPAYWGFWDLARIWLCFGLVIFRTFYTTVRFSVSLSAYLSWGMFPRLRLFALQFDLP